MNTSNINCIFCKKSRNECLKMIVSENYAVCDQCIALFSDLLKNSSSSTILQKKFSEKKKTDQLNSIKIKNFLDKFVIGQETAKMALCVSVVNHYKRTLFDQGDNDFSKSNLMLVGPSGSGKSLLIGTIAKFLNVPFISIDSTTLTEAGYIGQNVDTIITRLLLEANGDIEAAEHGIIFLDEIDKIAVGKNRVSITDGKVSGIQSALLKMIEGTTLPVNLNPETKKIVKIIEVDTSNMLFICGGAFIGLNEIVSNRLKKKRKLGFSLQNNDIKSFENECLTEDFIEYGLIPEFVGRFPMRTFTKELTEDELFQVLNEAKNNILSEYKFYFAVDKIKLEFTKDFIQEVVHKAKLEKTGVRGLRSICDSIMMPHLYLLPEYQKRNVAKITFFGDCVDKKTIPKIEIFEKKSVAKKMIE